MSSPRLSVIPATWAPDPSTLTPTQPPTATNKPSPLPTPLLHYLHTRCCSIPAHGLNLADSEGIENFWAKVVLCMDTYIVETVGLAEDAAAEDLHLCKLVCQSIFIALLSFY
jgi:hypothetical protein